MYIHIHANVCNIHADGGVMWIRYWGQHICMCDRPMTWLILACDMMRHMRDTKTSIYTGWRRPIECLRWQVIFRIRATNYKALLRKMTYKDKASYVSSHPVWCICISCIWWVIWIFIGHFPQKSPIISGFYANTGLQLKTSNHMTRHMHMNRSNA